MNLHEDRYAILIDYTIWANERILMGLKSLPHEEFVREIGGSYPSLQLTLTHLLEADWIWLNRWQSKPIVPVPSTWETHSADSIGTIWTDIQQQIRHHFKGVTSDALDEVIHFETRRGDRFSMPLWQTVHHWSNHGTYHRGQLTSMIRMVGYKPLPTDSFIFFTQETTC